MKINNEKLLEDELYLLKKLDSIKNIKYRKDQSDDIDKEHDLTLLYKHDKLEIIFKLYLDYNQRGNIKFEISKFITTEKPNDVIQNLIDNFEWKEGISMRDFFTK